MAAQSNRFEYLVPKENQEQDDSASYKAAGDKAAKKFNVGAMIDPNEGKQQLKANRFEHLIPNNDDSASQEAPKRTIDPGSNEGFSRALSGMFGEGPLGIGTRFSKPTGLGDMAIRAVPKLMKDVGSEYYDWAANASKNLGPALKYAAQHPVKASGDVAAGAMSMIDQLLSTPKNLPAISEHLGLTAPGSGDISRKIPNVDIAQYIPSGNTPESKFIKQTAQDFPLLAPVGKALIGAGKTGTKAAFSGLRGEDPIVAAKVDALEKDILGHQGKFEEANAEYNAKQQATQAAQSVAKQEPNVGVGDVDAMIRKQKQAEAGLGKTDTQVADLEKYLAENKPATPMDKEHQEAQDRLAKTQERHNNIVKTNEEIESQIANTVDVNADHNMRLSRGMKQKLDANKKGISAEYDKHYAEAEQKNAVLPKEDNGRFKKLMDDFYDLWKEDKHFTKEGDQLGEQIKALQKDEVIPGSKMIEIYKSINGYIRDANRKAYEPGANVADQARWRDRVKALEAKQEAVRNSLKTAIGEDAFNRLLATDAKWRDQVASLYKNPDYWTIMKGDRLSDNVIKDITTDVRGSNILQNIVKSDPEILKNAIGQRYVKAGKNFHQEAQTELLQPYIQAHPEINRLVNAKAANESVLANEAENLNRHKADVAELKTQAESRNTQLKEHNEVQKKLQAAKAKRDSYTQKISDLKKHQAEVKAKFDDENISLDKKLKYGAQLDKMKAELKELNSQLAHSEGVLRQVVRLGYRAIKHYGAKAIKGAM